MASEYTPNYNLDLYTDNDKPNLRDQYNGAITKIDTQLHEFSNNMVIVTDAANQARDKAATAQSTADANTKAISKLNTTVTEVDSAYKTADTKLSSDLTAAYKAADNAVTSAYKAADDAITSAYKAADATISNAYAQADANLNNTLTNLINAHFPIKSGDIQAGAITRDKLAAQALESLIKGITIRHFDSKDSSADNTGLVVPNSDVRLAGFYLPELTMLVITVFHVSAGAPVESFFSATTSYRLPSYVPHTTANNIPLNGIGIRSNSSSDFVSWTGIGINKDGYIGTNTGVTSNYGFDMAGSAVVFLRAYGVA